MTSRIITGLCLLAVGVFVIGVGGGWLFAWVSLVSLLCAYEWIAMAKKKGLVTYPVLVYASVGGALVSMLFPAGLAVWRSIWVEGVVLAVGALSLWELKTKKVFFLAHPMMASLRIVGSVAGTFPFIFLVRDGNQGFIHFLFGIVLIWVCDTVALFGGRAFGKTPLSGLSPKKTIEGSVIGFLASLVAAGIIIHHYHLPLAPYLILAMFIAVVSQMGDLHESLIKRYFGVKDSSRLLPGHGGIYDRADSTLFVMPLLFYFLNS